MDLLDVLETMRDPRVLETKVQRLKDRQGHTDLVDFFENELLGSMSEKYRQFAIGLRAQLELPHRIEREWHGDDVNKYSAFKHLLQ